ncbi:sterol desaturase family protein [Mangrovibrevibacter kandeliae]|uniref:sterol desaturase family protein n=1 Tax=Mangrovibrevibacter kandeliae TaxID=2968473 RepID=UPI0021178C47|nr:MULTISPECIES: sterol desaturase family protein [unclassified Aurantimonas]MCQ8781835.1 sterol desaturase family protein [Aurantimonas sp. CSK15Z-1]MCW4115508.1 sterol desaturase family protein [Aurantimonas sp. MSK8Z-1]
MSFWTSWPVLALIALAVFLLMEGVAWAAHKYIMHGWGWGWHRSHHEPHDGAFELNDLYAVVFAGFAIVLFYVGSQGYPVVSAVAVGITLYGLFYFIVHDGLVHQRWPFRHIPKRGYAKRLVQAHRLHHAVRGKADCVSFGFLYAPPVDGLRTKLRSSGAPLGDHGAVEDRDPVH